MTPAELLIRLKAESVGVSLSLDLEADTKPSDKVLDLIREHRDALLEHLACELTNTTRGAVIDDGPNVRGEAHLEAGANYAHERSFWSTRSLPRGASLELHGDLLHNLMVWAGQYSELRLERPGGMVLNAKPEHLTDALSLYPWGVVYDQTKAVLVTWGDVPRYALQGKRDLKSGALLVSEQVAA